MEQNSVNDYRDIINYWYSQYDESELSVDYAKAHKRCWRCGEERSLEKCHIVPRALQGVDAPSNLVLLCKKCHLENPNVSDPEIMWDWLKAYSTTFYDTFWLNEGLKEYEFIYKKSLEEELKDRNIIKNITDFTNELKRQFRNTTYHFGEPYLNRATIAGALRMTLKKFTIKKE